MNAIVRIPVTDDRDAWLAERRHDVTGSEIGALFGCHRYLTPAKLHAQKIGALADDIPASGPMARGVKLESFVAAQIMLRHPEWLVTKANDYYRDADNRVGGTPDYLIQKPASEAEDPEGKKRFGRWKTNTVLEIKTVGASDFKAIWRDGDPDGEILPEPWQIMQCLTYQHLTGAENGLIAVMVVGEWAPLEIHEIEVPRNDKLIAKMLDRVGAFWEAVDLGVPPEFDYDRDMAVIKALYGSAEAGRKLDLSWDGELPLLLDRREGLKGRAKDIECELTNVEARIRAKIGDAETVVADGWEATLKNQHRKAYSVEAADFRVLRAKRKEQRP